MTREELKAKIDELIGMESELVEKDETSAELRYLSPTGVLLFTIHISDYSGLLNMFGWHFGGQTSAVPNLWQELATMHR